MLVGVGYLVGVWGERMADRATLRPLAAVAGASMLADLASLTIAVLLGAGSTLEPGMISAAVIGAMLNVLLAIAALPARAPRAAPAPPPRRAGAAAGGDRGGHRGLMLTPVDPPQPPPDERPQSPQLALRVAVLGGIAVLLFSVLFFRLWVLQVLSVQEFQAQATENRERTVEVPAPRGMILDRKGRPLVRNRPGDRVTFDLSQDRELAEACGVRPYGAIDNRPEETITVRRNKAIKRALEALPKKAAEAAARSASRPPAPPTRCACGRAAASRATCSCGWRG